MQTPVSLYTTAIKQTVRKRLATHRFLCYRELYPMTAIKLGCFLVDVHQWNEHLDDSQELSAESLAQAWQQYFTNMDGWLLVQHGGIRSSPWLSARLQYLQSIRTGDTAVLHEAIDLCLICISHQLRISQGSRQIIYFVMFFFLLLFDFKTKLIE